MKALISRLFSWLPSMTRLEAIQHKHSGIWLDPVGSHDTNPFPPAQVDEDGIQSITVHMYFDEDGKWQMKRAK